MSIIKLEEIPIEKSEFCVLDFETTGTSAANGKVIEIGLVKVKNFKIVDKYQSFINPLQSIPPFITRLTGINYSDVEDAPLFRDVLLRAVHDHTTGGACLLYRRRNGKRQQHENQPARFSNEYGIFFYPICICL